VSPLLLDIGKNNRGGIVMAKREKRNPPVENKIRLRDLAFDQAPIPILVMDTDLKIVTVNAAAAELSSVRGKSILGKQCNEAFACEKGLHHCFGRRLLESDEEVLTGEHIVAGFDGQPVDVYVSVRKLFDEKGNLAGVVELMADLKIIGSINIELMEQARTDPLTGLGNRRMMFQALEMEDARAARHKRPYSVVMVDIDNFKKYNDAHGHPAGDEALKFVAGALRKNSRQEDMLARYGGEEFILVLPETDADGARVKAERLRSFIKETSKTGRRMKEPITVSIGVAECGAGRRCGPGRMLSAVDTALYEAKRNGRDRVGIAK